MKTLLLIVFMSISIFRVPARAEAAADAPRRVLIIGDSMMRITAHALELALSRRPEFATRAFTSLGSGLARLDVFDWLVKAEELRDEFDPDVTVIWFGTNDRQPMMCDGSIIQPDQPGWNEEYARRVGRIMDLLTAREGTRAIWLELPDMQEPAMQADVAVINRLVREQVAKRPAVEFLQTRPLLSRVSGKYSPYLIGPNGMPLPVRDRDGIHLNRAGADLLAEHLTEHLSKVAE
ncbi:MAG: DUF459 domain-containing protein [Kiritimatiellia bacterium]|nr:DUF459 domain-containing protein [Lentisphaerota bacterium]